MKKFLLLLCAVLVGHKCATAQQLPPWYQNLEKYWFYRYRLVNDFTEIGLDAGESMPAQQPLMGLSGGVDIDNPGRNGLKWGDATIDLGHYMGTLGTEGRLGSIFGRQIKRTNDELWLAQKALERIDNDAERYCDNVSHNTYPGSYPGSPSSSRWNNMLNGFFIRDDVPYLDFVDKNRVHFNRPYVNNTYRLVNKVSESAFYGSYKGPNPAPSTAWSQQTFLDPSIMALTQILQITQIVGLTISQTASHKKSRKTS